MASSSGRSCPLTTRPSGVRSPTSVAMAAAVVGWSPVIMAMRMPARRQVSMAAVTSFRGGSSMASRPRSSSSVSASSARPGTPPEVGRPATARTRRPRSVNASSASATSSEGLHRGSTASGAPFTRTSSPTTTDMRRRRGSNGNRARCTRARSVSVSRPRRLAKVSMAASVGSPWARHSPSTSCTYPEEQRTAERASRSTSARSSGVDRTTVPPGSYPASLATADPPGSHAVTIVIWFRVSVPVLSVQMNVVDPSVSTLSRLRTSTCRRAICSAPHASDKVTVGSRPSGTSATVTPMAKTNPSAAGLPSRSESTKKSPPTPTAMPATVRTRRCSSWVSGLGDSAVVVVSWAIDASRVDVPVAVTVASASPSTTNVPAYSATPASMVLGSLSPVSIDVSTSRLCAATVTASAGMRSPESSTIRSSTTTSAASIMIRRPSRRTDTSRGSMARSRSAAWSARFSWTKANTAFTTMTMKIATPSCGRPARSASPPAAQSMRAKKWRSWPIRRRSAETPGGAGSWFGPSRANRARASAVVRPRRGGAESSSMGGDAIQPPVAVAT